jgi:peptide/nickel transport system substrate-binding protein
MTRTLFNKKVLFVLVLSVALVFSGCQSDSSTSVNGANDKVLTILQGVDATTMDPNMHSESTTANIDRQIFDSLLDQDESMNIIPSLAIDWEMLDETTWKFNLRDDVYFHDGEQFTAQDVKYSIERIQDPENRSSQVGNFSAISEVVVDSDFEVTIKTYEPYPLMLVRLVGLRVVPMHYVEEVGNETFAANPVGTGPYMFERWVRDEFVSLAANDNYWQGEPEVKNVMFKPVPESAARVMALQAGEADIIVNLPPHQVSEIEGNENVDVVHTDSTRFIMLVFTTKNENVNDQRVRKAINYAIDVDSIVNSIFSGRATPTAQPVANFDLGFHSELDPYGYDLEKAQDLLDQAGYSSGISLRMGSPSGRYPMDREVAEAIAAQLSNAGFDVSLSFEEWGSYATKTLQGQQSFDLWLIGWGSSTFDAGSTLDFWLNTNLVTAYYQDSEYNPVLDSLLNESKRTMDDQAREELYHQVIEIIHEQAAFVPLYQQVDLYGVSQRVSFTPRADEIIRIFNVNWK